MPNFFSDSSVLKAITRLGELVLLNLCYLLCCLPVVTIGAATAALYAVCFRFGTAREGRAVGCFFRAFWQNLKKGIVLWLAVLALLGAALGLVVLFAGASGFARLGLMPGLMVLLVVLIVAGYTFPLLSLFENTCRGTLKNALILGLSYLPRSICLVAVNLSPVILLLVNAEWFLRWSILLIFLFFSAAAYLNTFLLRKVFTPFLPSEEDEAS